ncbi:MAG: metalloregulator ArsR/SmtB family transcription factor [Bacteroidota bacterium]|jgi:DNA-binding transcriptional ArsR family regulator|nr:helix-turn-helix transcriptional regulator [Flavisolibacter sp.]MDQ3550342.1 metalloregulator ArsR/SmtB family transcription factor [Bacteroidota bacterium]
MSLTVKGSSTTEKALFDKNLIKKGAAIIRAIKHPFRQELLAFIKKEGRINVSRIYNQLNLEQSVASQHLGILRRAGFVKAERQGKIIYYTVIQDRIRELDGLIKTLVQED